jgi:hypothetical protein
VKRWHVLYARWELLQDAGPLSPHAKHEGKVLRQKPKPTPRRILLAGILEAEIGIKVTVLRKKVINTKQVLSV